MYIPRVIVSYVSKYDPNTGSYSHDECDLNSAADSLVLSINALITEVEVLNDRVTELEEENNKLKTKFTASNKLARVVKCLKTTKREDIQVKN